MESKDDYEEEPRLWEPISDEEYDDNGYENYVHPDARKVAQDIFDVWMADNNNRMVLLKAQMQGGKTSVMRHLCYLINVKAGWEGLELQNNNSVFVLSHLNDNALVLQTASRLEGVMIDPIYNVFHPAKHALNPKAKDNSIKTLSHDRVLICDESHYGTGFIDGKANRIHELCELIKSPLWYDKETMVKENTYVVLISATPFAELGVNTEHKMVFTLQPSPAYWGIQKMLGAGKIYDSDVIGFFKNQVTMASLKNVMNAFTGAPGFVFIRENVHSKDCKKWVAQFKEVLQTTDEFGFFEMDKDNCGDPTDLVRAYGRCAPEDTYNRCLTYAKRRDLSGIDTVLGISPPKFIFIFIKEMLLAGKTLNTKHVRMVIDVPYKGVDSGNVDRIVQGLVGRCCGYKKNEDVVIVTNKKRVEAYVKWVNDNVAPSKPATHAIVKNRKIVAKDSAYIKRVSVGVELADEEEQKDDEEEEY